VAELLTAQLIVLVQEAPDPIYFYINSTGIAVRGHAAAHHAATAVC
jgi:ATP-dependent protease ClpP protease subunit